MKQYLSPEQTVKLIELGLPKPKTPISYSYPDQSEQQKAYEASLRLDPYLATVDQIEFEYAYSIGELIEMLPGRINGIDLTIDRYYAFEQWHIYYDASQYFTKQTELIGALYDMIVKLKEEGVI